MKKKLRVIGSHGGSFFRAPLFEGPEGGPSPPLFWRKQFCQSLIIVYYLKSQKVQDFQNPDKGDYAISIGEVGVGGWINPPPHGKYRVKQR